MVVPISAASADYAKEVKAALRSESFSADIDLADSKMEKKIREAQLEQYNYIVVCLSVEPTWHVTVYIISTMPYYGREEPGL